MKLQTAVDTIENQVRQLMQHLASPDLSDEDKQKVVDRVLKIVLGVVFSMSISDYLRHRQAATGPAHVKMMITVFRRCVRPWASRCRCSTAAHRTAR